jgi:translation initiation factor eIF-2B subunit alpha
VDLVLVGAEAVVESGGIINLVGTYQIALCARALKTPFYVAAESYKFSRRFPLKQRDVPSEDLVISEIAPLMPRGCKQDSPKHDYTPPSCISLLITDFGVLTPAAVSDELIQLYI